MQRLLVRHMSRTAIDVHAQVHRSKSGEPYIQTKELPRSGGSSEYVYVSDGASMLFWQQRTYRLIWDEGTSGAHPPYAQDGAIAAARAARGARR
jgi:hypothetical protein